MKSVRIEKWKKFEGIVLQGRRRVVVHPAREYKRIDCPLTKNEWLREPGRSSPETELSKWRFSVDRERYLWNHCVRILEDRAGRAGRQAMRFLKFSLFLFCVCFSSYFIPPNSSGQEAERVISVVATGVGTDSNMATQNGIRAAVEQAVGIYISSETIISNDVMLEDKIYSYSDGYVQEMKIISSRTKGGLVYVKMEAKVVASALKRDLANLGITVARVDGESLFAEAMSRTEQQESAEELLFDKLDKLRNSGLVVEFGKMRLLDPNRDKTQIEIPLTVKWNQDLINNLYDTVQRVAKKKRENVHKSLCDTVCFTNMNLISKGLISLTGVFDSFDNRGICDSNSSGHRAAGLFNVLFSSPVRVQISLRDKNDKTVSALNTIVNLSPEQLPRGYLCGICIGMDGTTKISLVDEISTDSLKDIVKMEGRASFPDLARRK